MPRYVRRGRRVHDSDDDEMELDEDEDRAMLDGLSQLILGRGDGSGGRGAEPIRAPVGRGRRRAGAEMGISEFAQSQIPLLKAESGQISENIGVAVELMAEIAAECASMDDFPPVDQILESVAALDELLVNVHRQDAALDSIKTQLLTNDEAYPTPEDLAREYASIAGSTDPIDTKSNLVAEVRAAVYAASKNAKYAPELGDDEDLMVTEERVDYKDPLTMILIEHVVKSGECGHMFEDATIRQFIREQNGRAECPVTGCNKYVTAAALVRDPHTERKLRKFKAELEKSQNRRKPTEEYEVVDD
ncbi:E3 SUMO-protein ligase NSE2 [Blastocladiella emersonii ATCC 22665]|nr:E3 SUMO-protein ligase NSE2 [Blastocladiella emersonii ATCC 22665]